MWGTLPRVFDRACGFYPGRTALIEADRRMSYAEMFGWANKIGNGLISLGVSHGDRVGLLMPNCLEFVPAMHGIWKAGAALVQLAARASVDDLVLFLRTSEATTLIYHGHFDDEVSLLRAQLPGLRRFIRLAAGNDAAPADPEQTAQIHADLDYEEVFASASSLPPKMVVEETDLAFVAFTSGTTGLPKGVLQTHKTWSHYSITAGLDIADIRPGEVFAHGGALSHFTQSFLMPTFIRGGTNVLLPSLDPDLLMEVIERERVSATAVVPTVLKMLVEHPGRAQAELSSLRTVVYSGSPMSPDALRRAIDVFGQIFVQTYAGTEQGYVSCLRKEEHCPDRPEIAGRLASAGRALFPVDISIRDESGTALPPGTTGEIWTAQTGQMTGYVDPDLDEHGLREGWVYSGDIGYLDEAGYLYVVDRKKDMIVTGGINVFPRQVEDILATHPTVDRCAVIGVPHPKWGEAVKAVVVLSNTAPIPPQELIELVKQRKGGAWAPKSIDFVESLPLTSSGKIDKKALRSPFWVGRQRQVN
jgi:acyl-CoA synthetase (AMP-forming)/AMP-acid ligase II